MSDKLSRRKLLSTSGKAILVGGVGAYASAGLAADESARRPSAPVKGIDYFDKLGVQTFINAAGTYTTLSASTMPDEVQAAVALASKKPVRLVELQDAAGEYLAKKLHCGGALVTTGATGAITLGAAACITLGNKDKVISIPTAMDGIKNEIIVQTAHSSEYDHAMRNCGAKMVKVNSMEEYEKAFTDKTVMTHYLNADECPIGREDWIRVAHAHRIPCFNDAAADVPPISNLWNYTKMGFDLVGFSGGKGLRGPQCTGLLLGRKDLIEAAKLNNSPNSNTVGRALKVAKEEIVGLVAAVDWFVNQDDAKFEAEYRNRADLIASHLKGIPTVETRVFIPPTANHVPHLLVTYDLQRFKWNALEVMEQMRVGNPHVELNPATGGGPASAGLPGGPNVIVVGVWMLQPGEDAIVGKRLTEVMQSALKG